MSGSTPEWPARACMRATHLHHFGFSGSGVHHSRSMHGCMLAVRSMHALMQRRPWQEHAWQYACKRGSTCGDEVGRELKVRLGIVVVEQRQVGLRRVHVELDAQAGVVQADAVEAAGLLRRALAPGDACGAGAAAPQVSNCTVP